MSVSNDGKVRIEVYSDEMSAVALIEPPQGGGKPVEVVDVKRALKEAGIVYGIVNNERIQAFVEQGKTLPVDFIVASGETPGHGEDASIRYSWEDEVESAPDDQAGKVDLRELNLVKSVFSGAVIARKTPPTRGKEGITVTGRKIPGEWGSDIGIKAGSNVKMSEDGTEFLAGLDGSPKLSGGLLSVDPVYVIKGDIDYSTGNMNFAGALEIHGNIQDGFVVKAEGNIIIGQNVQACQVISGGDVVVRGGIITRNEGMVVARGNVYAKFIENSEVEADQDVVVERAVINSRVRSNGSVICTSKEGKIMGGDIMAFREIRAKNLGTEKETATVLRAGFKFDVYLKLSEIEEKYEKVQGDLQRLEKDVSGAKGSQTEAVLEMKKKLRELEIEKTNLQKQAAVLKTRVQVNPFATVKGEEFIHPGCFVYVGGARERISNPMRFATLSADKEGGISLSAYDEMTGKIRTTNVGRSEKQTTVLVVDDAKFMRSKLRNILENSNFKVVGEAEDGAVAIQMYAKFKPDVVTMDITMPNVDGLSALKEIKKTNPRAKVVMISALGQKEKVKDAIISGALDFIIKPFVPEKVVEIISRVVEKK